MEETVAATRNQVVNIDFSGVIVLNDLKGRMLALKNTWLLNCTNNMIHVLQNKLTYRNSKGPIQHMFALNLLICATFLQKYTAMKLRNETVTK